MTSQSTGLERRDAKDAGQRSKRRRRQLQHDGNGGADDGIGIGQRAAEPQYGATAARVAQMCDLGERQRHECDGRRGVWCVAQRPQECRERREGNQQRVAEDTNEELPRENRVLWALRRPAHHVNVARFDGQRQCRERIRDHVQPEQLERRQRQRQPGQACHQQHQYFGDIAAEQIEDKLADVVEDDAAFLDGRSHGLEAVVLQHDRGRLLGHVGTAASHGYADVRLLQRRRVVDAVAEHGHDLTTRLQRLDDDQLVLGRNAAESLRAADNGTAVGGGKSVQLAPVETAVACTKDTQLAADRFGRQPLVASQHHRSQASRAKPRDRLLDAGGRRIGEPDEAHEGQPA